MTTATLPRAAAAAKRKTPAPTPANCEGRPADLGEYREAACALRKRQAEWARASRAVERTFEQLAAADSAMSEIAGRRTAALLAAFAAGKRELPDPERRALDDEERGLFHLTRDFEVEPETVAAMREQLAAQAEALGDGWQELRKVGRDLGCAKLSADAWTVLAAIDAPERAVFEISERLELLRDLCAAHELFRNPDERRSVIGIEFEKVSDEVLLEGMVMGRAGTLADAIGLEQLFAKWTPVVGKVETEPDPDRAAIIVAELRDMFFVQPYTEAECKAEWTMYVSPAGQGVLRIFKQSPEKLDRWTRARMETRVAEIDAAAAALREIQRTPF